MNDSNDKYRNLLFLVRSHSFSLILLVAGIAWTSDVYPQPVWLPRTPQT